MERLIVSGQKKLDWDVLMDLLKLSVDVCVMILAERNDTFVSMVWHDEDSLE